MIVFHQDLFPLTKVLVFHFVSMVRNGYYLHVLVGAGKVNLSFSGFQSSRVVVVG